MKRMTSLMALALMMSACSSAPESRDWKAESEAMFAWIEEEALTTTMAKASSAPDAKEIQVYLLPLEAFESLDANSFSGSDADYPRSAINMLTGSQIEQLGGTFKIANIDKFYVGIFPEPAICEMPDSTPEEDQAIANDGDTRDEGCFYAKAMVMGHIEGDADTRYYAIPQLNFGAFATRGDTPGALSLAPAAIDICGFENDRGKGNGSLEDDAIGICSGRLQAATASEQGMTIALDPITTKGLNSYVKAMFDAGAADPPEGSDVSFVWDFSQTATKGAAQ
jgi:hypothetical protein